MATSLQEQRLALGRSFTFRCFVHPSAGAFVAECVDLDLIVKAGTPDKALAGLQDSMIGYLRTVLDSGEIAGLVPRPSPLPRRLLYHWYCLKAALSGSGHRNFRLFDASSDQLLSFAG